MRALRLKSGTRNKYGAVRTVVDGIKLDSKAEARRYGELKLLERAHEIQGLKVHPMFDIWFPVRNDKILICKVELDFSYFDKRDNCYHYEDVKGKDNSLSKLKRKLVEAAYPIKVEIIK